MSNFCYTCMSDLYYVSDKSFFYCMCHTRRTHVCQKCIISSAERRSSVVLTSICCSLNCFSRSYFSLSRRKIRLRSSLALSISLAESQPAMSRGTIRCPRMAFFSASSCSRDFFSSAGPPSSSLCKGAEDSLLTIVSNDNYTNNLWESFGNQPKVHHGGINMGLLDFYYFPHVGMWINFLFYSNRLFRSQHVYPKTGPPSLSLFRGQTTVYKL